ncbi:MAG: ABC transporter ATP-binding protein [Gordonia sp. (in: high G+C Gram-positive bacteria)]
MRISGSGVSWSAGGRLIVDDVELTAETGTIVGLLGPNGSGKSSLLRIMAGLRAPSCGVVTLGDEPLASRSRRDVAKTMAFIEQSVSTDQNPLVRDVIDLGRIPHRRAWAAPSPEDAEIVRRAAALTHLEDRLDQRYSTLSGGERQRVQLSRALAQEPAVLLLDEPTNHLDVRHQLDILSVVRQAGITSVVALHDLNLAATFCDRVVVLDGGRAVAGGEPRTVLTPDLIRAVFDVDARLIDDEHGLHIRFLPN